MECNGTYHYEYQDGCHTHILDDICEYSKNGICILNDSERLDCCPKNGLDD